MKKKFPWGYLIGAFLGSLILVFIYILENNFDCFSCGFIGVGYCNWAGMCSESSSYMNIIGFFSTPFILFVAAIYYFFFEKIASVYTYTIELWPFFILYWALLGHLIEKIVRRILVKYE